MSSSFCPCSALHCPRVFWGGPGTDISVGTDIWVHIHSWATCFPGKPQFIAKLMQTVTLFGDMLPLAGTYSPHKTSATVMCRHLKAEGFPHPKTTADPDSFSPLSQTHIFFQLRLQSRPSFPVNKFWIGKQRFALGLVIKFLIVRTCVREEYRTIIGMSQCFTKA